MAKKSMRLRETKRAKLVKKYENVRYDLKTLIKSSTDPDIISESLIKLGKLPVNSNRVRYMTRCEQCGRAHAVYRKFGLCRICLREQLMRGNVPGARKSSW